MIELCFRWIKQPLKLRHFYGTSENAVRNQIAVALIAFVLIKLAHAAQGAGVEQFGRLTRATALHRKPLDQLKRTNSPWDAPPLHNHAQGRLF